jgi:hypothetical protein
MVKILLEIKDKSNEQCTTSLIPKFDKGTDSEKTCGNSLFNMINEAIKQYSEMK